MESAEVTVAVKHTPLDALRTAISKMPNPISIRESMKRIILKPAIYNPDIIGNTSTEMMSAIIQTFSNIAPIDVVESDSPIRTTEYAFKMMGYDDFVEEVQLVNLSKVERIKVQMAGHFFKSHEIPNILLSNDLLVNVPSLKTSSNVSGLSGGTKNLFGLLPETDKSVYHSNIDSVLMDILSLIKPDVTIMDLTNVVFGNRDTGKNVHIGGVVIGTDPIAVDAYCATLFDIDPVSIPHLKRAAELGLGVVLPEHISVHGTDHQIQKIKERCRSV